MKDVLLPRRSVAQALGGVHVETVKRWEREGRLPAPVRISRKTVGHLQSTVDRFLERLASQRAEIHSTSA